MDILQKQPAEVIDYTFDFTLMLAPCDTLAATTPVVSIVNEDAPAPVGDAPPVLGMLSVDIGTGMVKQRISGGTDKNTYKVTCLVMTSAGEKLEVEFKLLVKDI